MKRLTENTVFSGVGHRLPLGDLPDEPLAVLGEGDDRRRDPRAFLIDDDGGLPAFHHRDDRVGGAEVDSNDFACHVCSVPPDCAESIEESIGTNMSVCQAFNMSH